MKINNDDVYELPYDFNEKKYPYTAYYIRLYGMNNCMSDWDLKPPYKTTEQVYKECIKKETTWKKLLHFKGYSKNYDQ